MLLEHPQVASGAVIGVPDEGRGMILKAFVVPANPGEAGSQLARALQSHVKHMLAPYKYPRRVEFCEALPMTPTGTSSVRRCATAHDAYSATIAVA